MAAASVEFASLDGTVFGGAASEDTCQPTAGVIARRSVSIFSRRGSETFEPTPPFITQATMAKVPKLMTDRQQSWMGRRRSVGSPSAKADNSPTKSKLPRGTVLNAVPQARKIKMTALEEEMATSPNDEILSAICDHSPVQTHSTPASPSTPMVQRTGIWSRNTSTASRRTKSQKRVEKSSRIGIWADGVVHWEHEAAQERALWEQQLIQEDFGLTPLHQHVNNIPHNDSTKPSLSVVIPHKQVLIRDVGGSKPGQNQIQPVYIVPSAISSASGVASLGARFGESNDVSPLSAQPPPRLERPDTPVQLESRNSSSSLSDAAHSDVSGLSSKSKRSSATSIDEVDRSTPEKSRKHIPRKSLPVAAPSVNTKALSIEDVVQNVDQYGINKPLPANPAARPQRIAPPPPRSRSAQYARHESKRLRKSLTARSVTAGSRAKYLRPTRSLTELDAVNQDFMRASPYPSDAVQPTSPTLSQAEHDLKAQLSSITEDRASVMEEPGSSRTTSLRRGNSVRSVMQPPEQAPTLPPRSRKREWRTRPRHVAHLALPSSIDRRRSESNRQAIPDGVAKIGENNASVVRRSMSALERIELLSPEPAEDGEEVEHDAPELPRKSSRRATSPRPPPRIVIDDGKIVVHGPVTIRRSECASPTVLASAEDVLLNILSSLASVDDLFNAAIINKGMYRVYKENEMHLIQTVLFNQSPAAWECMAWSPPTRNEVQSGKASSQLEHTPMSYMTCYKRDLAVIQSLKAMIFAHCQTFIRRETASALSNPSHPNAQRFDDAFWRIWCFSKIFGRTSRQEDLTGQLDWLKGGVLTNNLHATATVDMNLDFELSSVLLNAPDFFAAGNGNGLGTQQLYDMTEIWTCLSALLQGYQGRVDQARSAGIFDDCNIAEGDFEKEEQMLEDWTHHLLTLGPSTVLIMAEHAGDRKPTGYNVAKENGWTNWTAPLHNGTFLKEPVSRLYEARIAAAAQEQQNPHDKKRRQRDRKRVASLAAEIRLARQSSQYKRLPYIDMNSERAMSIASRQVSRKDGPRRSGASPLTIRQSTSPMQMTPSSPNFSHRASMSPRPTSAGHWSPRRDLQPLVEDRVQAFTRLSLASFEGLAEDTSNHAIKRIVDMGFSPTQAREALRITDMGDGLRVDRAVDLLLRQRL